MLKNIIAVNIAKIVALSLKILNLGAGTSMPGIIANKISKSILSDLINQTKQNIIAVSGTNGKTTTANFISEILKCANYKVANNSKGANMLTGITTAMIENSNFLANFDIDNTVLEADEAYLQKFADYFTANYLVITNLFQDQVDRYGDVNETLKLIKKAITKFEHQSFQSQTSNPTFTLILNADIPTIQTLANQNTIYFGFEDVEFDFKHHTISSDDVFCDCGQKYLYRKRYYGNVGHYNCSCGIKRPDTFLEAKAKIFIDYSILYFKNKNNNETFSVKINMPGIYNAYNALAAITLAIKMDISAQTITKAFSQYQTVFGRAQTAIIKNKKTITQLIKNPVGTTEVLQTVYNDKKAQILIAINDNFGDGRDISWIWDANFELLKNHNNKIVVSGNRYADVAGRLKYAGIEEENIILEPNLEKAFLKALNNTNEKEKLYILPCYTALIDLQKILKKI